MNPSVCRIVQVHLKTGETRPAIITHVYDDGSGQVDLTMFRRPCDFSMANVSLMGAPKNVVALERMTIMDRPPTAEERAINEVWVCWPPRSETSQEPGIGAIGRLQNLTKQLLNRVNQLEERAGPKDLESTQPQPIEFNIGYMAREVYEAWRRDPGRGYSPFNKPWEELSEQARRNISRQARQVIDIALTSIQHIPGYSFRIVDPYADLVPGPVPEMISHSPSGEAKTATAG